MEREKSGTLWVVSVYIIWGFLPIYWKLIDHVSSIEILVSRVVWAFVLTLLLILLMGNWRQLLEDVKTLWQSKRDFWLLCIASLLISGNWFTYIWAVNHNYLVQTSLGYYINPLISLLLGVFFLKEKLTRGQQAAFLIAAVGVVILTVSYGEFPWLSFVLAFSFAFYGFLKKTIRLDALRGMAIETAFIAPFALGYHLWLFVEDRAVFLHGDIKTDLLLIFTGAATALPLVMFAKGAQLMPLYMIGFFQYISPTLMLFLGVIVYGESFSQIDLLSFACIWTALVLFTMTNVVGALKTKEKVKV